MKMINKRIGVFETNSSSSHSVTISKDSVILDTLPLDEDGNLALEFGKFGWEEEVFHDIGSKWEYACTYYQNYATEREKDLFEQIVKEHTGAKTLIIEKTGDDYHGYGYIDHQSVDIASEIFLNENNLKMFLFNPNSYFETDNDNH